jgi:molybdenum cofactor biosynthesis protein B
MSTTPERPFKPVGIAVLTISDSRSLEEDKSGATLAARIADAGHVLADRKLVRDELAEIQAVVKGWIADPQIDAVITTGGTGLTGRDITPEAVRPLFEKEIDGFSVVMHLVSFQKIGTSTVQSRSLAGVANATYIFCLPGSPGACRDAWDGILAQQFDYRHRPCNFVEIMPRLDEHMRGKG